jgi:AcrR family transcriptional regulator
MLGLLGFPSRKATDMRRRAELPDFAPKKRPAQERSRQTFDALVEACTGLLPERGYAGTTTNHIAERAGVSVASLYEFFPGKDAIVAQVAERMVARVLARLGEGLPRVLEAPEDEGVRLWIELIYKTVAREKALVAVFQREIPYTNQLAPIRAIGPRLLAFSQGLRTRAGEFVRSDFSDARMHLLINLVSSTILQCVLDPPSDVSRRALLDELTLRVEEWIRR